jgi:hypothetical protein
MDANKLEKLKEVGYTIQPVCMLCKFSKFESEGSVWGVCRIHWYQHQTHTNSKRQMSINALGHCPKFKSDITCSIVLGRFAEFFKNCD